MKIPTVRIPDPNRDRERVAGEAFLSKRKGRSKRRMRILSRDSFLCNHCSQPFPESNLEVDHIIPLVQGGSDDDCNLQTLCKPCHLKKTVAERKT
jgi:5-methylcytosine-specific restriction enzyme A